MAIVAGIITAGIGVTEDTGDTDTVQPMRRGAMRTFLSV
jgi:hypothetical protein